LRAGAARALAALGALAHRTARPVLLAEVGYPSLAGAAVKPWEEGGGVPDPEAQRACYEALLEALEPCDWAAGAFWWKWSSGGEPAGSADLSYSPRGKPAETVLRSALRRWEGRPVRVPTDGR